MDRVLIRKFILSIFEYGWVLGLVYTWNCSLIGKRLGGGPKQGKLTKTEWVCLFIYV